MVELGFKSESSKSKSLNFVGGSPRLLIEMPQDPLCDQCSSIMRFVCQLSTPMSAYSRALYIYSCLKVSCNSKANGWKAFRQISTQPFKKSIGNANAKKCFIEFQTDNSPEIPSDKNFADSIDNSEWIGEKYEKQIIPGYSKFFKNFTRAVSENPDQILRYEWNGIPLLYSEPNFFPIKNCDNCGSERVFEFQLMPFMHSLLSEANDTTCKSLKECIEQASEWETVLIFSCKNDCGQEEIVQEICVVQCDS